MIEEEKVRAGPGGTPCGRPYGKGESRTRDSPSFVPPLGGSPIGPPASPRRRDGRRAAFKRRPWSADQILQGVGLVYISNLSACLGTNTFNLLNF